MIPEFLVNNLWVLLAGLLVFVMTIAVGFLEVGELGDQYHFSLLKTVWFTGAALVLMGAVGFNIAFAPTWHGVIGNPVYGPGLFLGGFDTSSVDPASNVWWSMGPNGFNTGLTTGVYFLFETAFAAVTLALVGVIFLKKVRFAAIAGFTVVYFLLIWDLPAAWIWNPSGWLAQMGMVDFAGGLVVHGAAGAAGLGVLVQIWREERARGLATSPQVGFNVRPGWFTLGILLLWIGWFGFNPGSVLQFNDEAIIVVETTFLAAAACMVSLLGLGAIYDRANPPLVEAGNGILMGLIIITPLAGFVSPGSAILLGLLGGPLFILGERLVARLRWLTDPVGLMPGHLLGGLFGVAMIAFFTQQAFAAGSGFPALPNGLLFGGGTSALHQFGIEVFGSAVVIAVVFALSFATMAGLARLLGGISEPTSSGASAGQGADAGAPRASVSHLEGSG